MVLLPVLPSMAASRVSRVREGQLSFPQTRSLPMFKTNTQESTRGRNKKRVKGGGKFQASDQLEISENQAVIAKSHPVVGTLRASSQSL